MVGEWFLHYSIVKRGFTIKPVIGCRLLVANRLDPSIKFLEPLLESSVPANVSFKKLRRVLFESQTILQMRAWRGLLPWFRAS